VENNIKFRYRNDERTKCKVSKRKNDKKGKNLKIEASQHNLTTITTVKN
jgi:hypothetical protein